MFNIIKENIYIKKIEKIIQLIESSIPHAFDADKRIPQISIGDNNEYIVELGFGIMIIYSKEKNINLTLFINYIVFYMDQKLALSTIATYTLIGNIIGAVFPSYDITITTKKLEDNINIEAYKSNKVLEYLKNYFNDDEDFENLINKINSKFGNA